MEKCEVLEDAIFRVQNLALVILDALLWATSLRSYLFVKLFLPIHIQVGFTIIVATSSSTCPSRLSCCIVADTRVGSCVCHGFTALFQGAIITCLDFDRTFLMIALLRLLL